MNRHFFSVDVEEYFHVSAFEGVVARESWATRASRVEPALDSLLDLLSRAGATGTFFILGWLAERRPDLVRRIAAAGHEVASHGWDHKRVTHQVPAEFRESVRSSKLLLEDLTGAFVGGFRAPSFSIVPGREWALDILLEEGYTYDSSLYPVGRPGYGYPGGRRDPYWIERPAGRIAEFPPATLRLAGLTLPAGGGAYFRLFPYGLTRAALLRCARRGVPGTFYIHPWELDPEQPRIAVGALTRIRHYGGLSRTHGRLLRLLEEFEFRSIGSALLDERPIITS